MENTVLTKEDEVKIMETMRDFVLRVGSETGNKTPEEVQILPAITTLVIQCFTN